MADFWTTPKINWVTNDGIGFQDLNRMEANTSAVRDATRLKLQGFGYTVDNTPDDALMTIKAGSGYSSDGIPIHMSSVISKNLNPFVAGTGVGGMAPGAPAAIDNTWYYIFVIMDPTDGSTDIMIDDNVDGDNVISGTFTVKRRINSIKSASIAGGDLKLVEMYSTGDKVFINPNSMFSDRSIKFILDVPGGDDNKYFTRSLFSTTTLQGFALPALEVLAKLNARLEDLQSCGFISTYLGLHTVPVLLLVGSVFSAEILIASEVGVDTVSDTFEIMVDTARTVAIAMRGTVGSEIFVAVVGYTDERLA